MKIAKKYIAFILSLILCAGVFWNTNTLVKAADLIDGSELLIGESESEGVTNNVTRGIYLGSGTSSISKAGTGKIAAGGTTIAQKVVSTVSVTVRVERLVNGSWASYTSWSATNYNSASASTSKTLSVPSGYYYRVRCTHYANSDSSSSYTNGIWI